MKLYEYLSEIDRMLEQIREYIECSYEDLDDGIKWVEEE